MGYFADGPTPGSRDAAPSPSHESLAHTAESLDVEGRVMHFAHIKLVRC